MASAQESSIFWNCVISGLSVEVTAGWVGAEARHRRIGSGCLGNRNAAGKKKNRKTSNKTSHMQHELPLKMITPRNHDSLTPGEVVGERKNCRIGALNQRLQPLRLVQGDEGVFDRDPAVFAELAQGAGDGFAGGAGH